MTYAEYMAATTQEERYLFALAEDHFYGRANHAQLLEDCSVQCNMATSKEWAKATICTAFFSDKIAIIKKIFRNRAIIAQRADEIYEAYGA